eukprot:scaffold680483_cov60-Prasinocladus_malaysianus.AAC.1
MNRLKKEAFRVQNQWLDSKTNTSSLRVVACCPFVDNIFNICAAVHRRKLGARPSHGTPGYLS